MTNVMLLNTLRGRGQVLFPTANQTTSTYTPRVPTLTEPSGAGIVKGLGRAAADPDGFGGDARGGASLMRLVLVGQGSVAQSMGARVIGWQEVTGGPPGGRTTLWVPQTLLNLTGTLGAVTGAAGFVPIAGATRFCDTLSPTSTEGLEGTASVLFAGAGAEPIASVVLDMLDFSLFEVQVSRLGTGGGFPLSVNAIVSAF